MTTVSSEEGIGYGNTPCPNYNATGWFYVTVRDLRPPHSSPYSALTPEDDHALAIRISKKIVSTNNCRVPDQGANANRWLA